MNRVASTILEQLSPSESGTARGRLAAMIGAHNFWSFANGVQFHFKGCCKWSGVQITLDPDDTYVIWFWKLDPTQGYRDRAVAGIHAEDLARHFSEVTGLATVLA